MKTLDDPLDLYEILHKKFDYCEKTGKFFHKDFNCPKVYIGCEAGTIKTNGYKYLNIYNKFYSAHRMAWLYINKSLPVGVIDHINRNRTDNRISNLRDVTKSQNGCNAGLRKDNLLKMQGVGYVKRTKKYRARIRLNNKEFSLGSFVKPEEAYEAYKVAKKKFHGIEI